MTTSGEATGRGWPPFRECRCGAPLFQHEYVDIGSAVAGSKEQADIEGYIDYDRWNRLPFAETAVSGEPIAVFRGIRCPSGGGHVVPLVLSKSVVGDDVICGTVYM